MTPTLLAAKRERRRSSTNRAFEALEILFLELGEAEGSNETDGV
jgi:hypothetical protein